MKQRDGGGGYQPEGSQDSDGEQVEKMPHCTQSTQHSTSTMLLLNVQDIPYNKKMKTTCKSVTWGGKLIEVVQCKENTANHEYEQSFHHLNHRNSSVLL